MELYVLIAVLVSIICYQFARDDNKNKLIRDLYERVAAKDRDEYLQNTGQQPEQPEIEWDQPNYYTRPKAVVKSAKRSDEL